jgi:hypothetical protein
MSLSLSMQNVDLESKSKQINSITHPDMSGKTKKNVPLKLYFQNASLERQKNKLKIFNSHFITNHLTPV